MQVNAPDTKHRAVNLKATTIMFLMSALAALWIAPSGITTAAGGNEKSAGLMQWSFTYHDISVPVAIWYPSSEPITEINTGPFTLTAASNAPLPAEPHSLLILSHGTGGSNIAHHTIAESLATAGYIVAAPTHPGDNYQDRSLVTDDRYFIERPRQLQSLLNAMTHDDKLSAIIDTTRIGAIGHSIGGYAVAVVAGATPNRELLTAHCDQVTDDPSCHYRDPSLGVSSPATEGFVLPESSSEYVAMDKPVIRSIALLAPFASAINPASQIDKEISVKVITAELDSILPHSYHGDRFKQIAPHGEFRQAAGAGHFSFIAPINEPWHLQLKEVSTDPGSFDRQVFHQQLGRELTQWFDKTLPSAPK